MSDLVVDQSVQADISDQRTSITQSIQNIRVIKRDGTLAEYDPSRIRVAISKAFIDVEGNDVSLSNRLNETATKLTNYISEDISKFWPAKYTHQH